MAKTPRRPPRALTALALAAALLFAGCELTDSASETEDEAVAEVLANIEAGTPSPYAEDGATFQNREGLLPPAPIGYYKEYTVPTPGSSDRGARRLVIGAQGETYYTNDHYASFEEIDPEDFK